MPCYGESCCDFCGVQVSATFDAGDSDDEEYIKKYGLLDYKWMKTAEVIDKNGKIYENMEPNLMYELENGELTFTNTCLHWVKPGGRLKEGVFLHNLCRNYIVSKTGWTLKQIFERLRKDRHKFIYNDHQRSIYNAIEDGDVELWRVTNPEKK